MRDCIFCAVLVIQPRKIDKAAKNYERQEGLVTLGASGVPVIRLNRHNSLKRGAR